MSEESKQPQSKLLNITDFKYVVSLCEASFNFMNTKLSKNVLAPEKEHIQVANNLIEIIENIFEVVGS